MIVFSVRPRPFNYFSLFSVNLLLELLGLLSLVKKNICYLSRTDLIQWRFNLNIYVYTYISVMDTVRSHEIMTPSESYSFCPSLVGFWLIRVWLVTNSEPVLSVLRMNRGVCQPEERRSSGLSHSPCSPPFTLRRSTWYSLTNTLSPTIMQAAITACSTV